MKPKIGAYVLETLTTGMYTDPLDSLREYVQNSSDSIRRAESGPHPIIRVGEGRIMVTSDQISRRLTVRDNGLGVASYDVQPKVLNVGMSDKAIGVDAGFRGIGRLAGIAYCDQLVFRTSAPAEALCTTVTIDCIGVRKAIAPGMRQIEELADVLDRYSTTVHEPYREDEHFFEVIMDGLTDSASSFLELPRLEEYLSQVAPVEFDAQRFLYAPKITEWAREHGLPLPTVTLLVGNSQVTRQVFKPYKTHYRTQRNEYDVHVRDVAFWPEDPGPEPPFWLWYGITELAGMLDDNAAGFRLRKHNIAVGGPQRMAEMFAAESKSNARFNAYYIGEVHVCSRDIVPNARRDGFEDSDHWIRAREDLAHFIAERCEEIRATSNARNRPAVKVVATVNKVIEEVGGVLETGIVSDKECKTLLDRVKREHYRLRRALESRKHDAEREALIPLETRLAKLRESLQNGRPDISKRLPSTLDRKQRKLVVKILQVLQRELDEDSYRRAKDAIMRALGVAVPDA